MSPAKWTNNLLNCNGSKIMTKWKRFGTRLVLRAHPIPLDIGRFPFALLSSKSSWHQIGANNFRTMFTKISFTKLSFTHRQRLQTGSFSVWISSFSLSNSLQGLAPKGSNTTEVVKGWKVQTRTEESLTMSCGWAESRTKAWSGRPILRTTVVWTQLFQAFWICREMNLGWTMDKRWWAW